MPTYLKEARNLSDETAVGALLSDCVIRHAPDRKWSLGLCGGGAILLSALWLAGVRYSEQAIVEATSSVDTFVDNSE